MEEKYITKLLTFSDENLMGNVETISLTRKNVKELLNELHQNYIPISVIEKKINELNEKMAEQLYIIKEFGEHKVNRGKLTMYKEQRDILIELLDERSNIDVQLL